ncbi:acetoin utilization protein AcuC [Infirmifilum lucidum]|uniref:Acetoin utilization protein AcuC n=1 Tax=Infirmifilum lucidum TaxID=2776706 RepID=A0A7L9FEN3_9CREN|nr:acetoin utilization protein AcuC [Infirmifilum lucidum]QOJ78147.1 acetoin utilization protein AcuC [Infirmifilum lucidum]
MLQVFIAYSEDLERIAFMPPSLKEAWTGRIKLFYREYVPQLGEVLPLERVEPSTISEEELLRAHDKEYIDFVKRKSIEGMGLLDYGDTPAYPGVFENALETISATLTLAQKLLVKGGVGFNPNGGFHHARRRSAGGFCVFNDLAVAALWLREKGLERIAIVDIDAHHGDGTQQILYSSDILKISIHGYGYGFYPGTGWIDELGEGVGYCRNINIPLPLGSGDDAFIIALREVVESLLSSYDPQFLIIQGGADGHRGDPLTYLNFTENSYIRFASLISRLASRGVPVLVTGGGGYVPSTVARIWALMIAGIAGSGAERFLTGDEETESGRVLLGIVEDRLSWLKNKIDECGL